MSTVDTLTVQRTSNGGLPPESDLTSIINTLLSKAERAEIDFYNHTQRAATAALQLIPDSAEWYHRNMVNVAMNTHTETLAELRQVRSSIDSVTAALDIRGERGRLPELWELRRVADYAVQTVLQAHMTMQGC